MNRVLISIPPKILIISLQKFDYVNNNNKNEYRIDIDKTLIIDDYIYIEYVIINIIYMQYNHIGSINFWHYYSLNKIEKRKNWTLFDDSLVKL